MWPDVCTRIAVSAAAALAMAACSSTPLLGEIEFERPRMLGGPMPPEDAAKLRGVRYKVEWEGLRDCRPADIQRDGKPAHCTLIETNLPELAAQRCGPRWRQISSTPRTIIGKPDQFEKGGKPAAGTALIECLG